MIGDRLSEKLGQAKLRHETTQGFAQGSKKSAWAEKEDEADGMDHSGAARRSERLIEFKERVLARAGRRLQCPR